MEINKIKTKRKQKQNEQNKKVKTKITVQNFNLIFNEWKLENKRFHNNRNKAESKTRKTVIFDTKCRITRKSNKH